MEVNFDKTLDSQGLEPLNKTFKDSYNQSKNNVFNQSVRQKSVSIEPKKAISHIHIPSANQTFMMNPITVLDKKSVASGLKLKNDRSIVIQEGVPLE